MRLYAETTRIYSLVMVNLCAGNAISVFVSRVLVAAASVTRNSEGEIIQFSRLEALDPTKRELLEARFSAPRVRTSRLLIFDL